MAPNEALRAAPTVQITHRYLWAWDTLLESFPGWKAANQRRAAEADAPADAVYWDGDRYVTFSEWATDTDDDSRWRLQRAVEQIQEDACAS